MVLDGVPGHRTDDYLNIGLEPADDARHDPGGPLPYEWWYFDASFENGYSAVAIVWPMNYSKPWRRQCTVQLSIYTPEGETCKHYIFPPRSTFQASRNTCDVRVGKGFMRGQYPRYEISLEAEGDGVELVFESEVPGWKPGQGANVVPFPLMKTMGWLVPVPRARVSGRLRLGDRVVEVEGHGYHDHNWGETPIFHVVDNWHWGHVIAGEVGITWADITMQKSMDYQRAYMFLLSKAGRLVYESPDIRVRYDDWCDDGAFLHPYPRRISVAFGEGVSSGVGVIGAAASGEIVMTVEKVIETQDLLEMVGIPAPLIRAVNRMFSKPYYFRWLSHVTGSIEVDGQTLEVDERTIHEQMLFRGRRPREMMMSGG